MKKKSTSIRRVAFNKDSIIFVFLIVAFFIGMRWYVLEKGEKVAYSIAENIGEFSANLLVSEEVTLKSDRFVELFLSMVAPGVKLYHFKKVNELSSLGYAPYFFSSILEDVRNNKRATRKIEYSGKNFLDVFILEKGTEQAMDLWIVRTDISVVGQAIRKGMRDIVTMFLMVGGGVYLIFLYISAQLRANSIGNDEKRRKLYEINQELRLHQDEVLKRQTELVMANQKYESMNRQLSIHAKDLENNKTAMLNMLQDIEYARQEADRANKAKSIFLASMSHEIRTPMNGILGMIDICLSTPLNAEQKDYLETAHSSGVVLMSLLNDILDFSKIEAGKLDLEIAEFDIYRVIQDIVLLFRQKVYEKKLEILVQFDLSVPMVLLGDGTRIRQILSNLVSNSVKFTNNGYILIRVCEKKEKEGELLYIEVHDTGVGMTKEQSENLFKPFTQADASISRKFGGSGLGLTISKQLAQLMGGDIYATSDHEKGSIFYVKLPLQVASERKFLLDKSLKRKTFLLIIPNKMVLENVIYYLSQLDVEYLAIKEESDFEKIEVRGWSGCIIDFRDVSVHRFLKKINEVQSISPEFKVLGLFNFLQRAIAEELKEKMGMTVLYKPILPQSLHDHLAEKRPKQEETTEDSERFKDIAKHIEKNIFILVAEDNLVNQKVIRSYLEKMGFYNTVVVSNGQEAFQYATTTRVDIIFMDIQMPVMDGLKATMAIREYEKENHKERTPIIALTAHSYVGEQKRCSDAGMDDYVGKPIQLDRLVLALEKWSNIAAHRSLESSDNIDRAYFNQTKEALGKSFSEVVDIFMSDCLENIKFTQESIANNNLEKAAFFLHQVKSSAAHFGMLGLSHCCEALENLVEAKERSHTVLEENLLKILNELEKVKMFLQNEIVKDTNE